MHNNHYFLRQLSRKLNDKITGFTLVSCFSQNKDELVIELNNKEESFFIKAYLQSPFSCLSFPTQFNRAGKNTIDLFHPLLLKKILSVDSYTNERSFSIRFEGDYMLVFKMHSNQANILLANNNMVIGIFRNQFKTDLSLDLNSLNRVIDWSEDAFISNHQNLKKYYFTFGREVWKQLTINGFDELVIEKQWALLKQTLKQLETPQYYILKENEKFKLSLFNGEHALKSFVNPIEAINEFFYLSISNQGLSKEKIEAFKKLRGTIETGTGYIQKNLRKLQELEVDTHYKIWADLLMANMHSVNKGVDTVALRHFTSNELIAIKLKPDLSVQKNAEIFYRKSKNQEIEINKLKESISRKEEEIKTAMNLMKKIEAVGSVKEFKKIYSPLDLKSKSNPDKKLPFHKFEHLGFQIWVGKNAISNDQLTLKYSHKDDLWLHVKDISGSHVLIKHKPGVNFPKEVIESAAALAAYNSKRKNETLCPVIYTPKKFVRKRKGDPAGAMVVEREQVIMVQPRLIG